MNWHVKEQWNNRPDSGERICVVFIVMAAAFSSIYAAFAMVERDLFTYIGG
jgi:hypothetical protein